MKTKREHRVPLSGHALEVLHSAQEFADGSGLVFPLPISRVLSGSTLSKLCRENEIGCVPHGMRSSFRDWAAECSDTSREVCELALAHVNSDRVGGVVRIDGDQPETGRFVLVRSPASAPSRISASRRQMALGYRTHENKACRV